MADNSSLNSSSAEFVEEYFGRSVVLFRDDKGFMHQMKALIEEDFPSEVKEHLLYLYLDELSADLA